MVSLWILGCVVVLCCIHSGFWKWLGTRTTSKVSGFVEEPCQTMSLQKLRDVTGHTPRRFAMRVPLQNCIISFCCDFARAGVNDKPLASVSLIFPAASSACQVGLGRAEQAKEDLEEVPGFSGLGPNENMSKWNVSPWNTMKYRTMDENGGFHRGFPYWQLLCLTMKCHEWWFQNQHIYEIKLKL